MHTPKAMTRHATTAGTVNPVNNTETPLPFHQTTRSAPTSPARRRRLQSHKPQPHPAELSSAVRHQLLRPRQHQRQQQQQQQRRLRASWHALNANSSFHLDPSEDELQRKLQQQQQWCLRSMPTQQHSRELSTHKTILSAESAFRPPRRCKSVAHSTAAAAGSSSSSSSECESISSEATGSVSTTYSDSLIMHQQQQQQQWDLACYRSPVVQSVPGQLKKHLGPDILRHYAASQRPDQQQQQQGYNSKKLWLSHIFWEPASSRSLGWSTAAADSADGTAAAAAAAAASSGDGYPGVSFARLSRHRACKRAATVTPAATRFPQAAEAVQSPLAAAATAAQQAYKDCTRSSILSASQQPQQQQLRGGESTPSRSTASHPDSQQQQQQQQCESDLQQQLLQQQCDNLQLQLALEALSLDNQDLKYQLAAAADQSGLLLQQQQCDQVQQQQQQQCDQQQFVLDCTAAREAAAKEAVEQLKQEKQEFEQQREQFQAELELQRKHIKTAAKQLKPKDMQLTALQTQQQQQQQQQQQNWGATEAHHPSQQQRQRRCCVLSVSGVLAAVDISNSVSHQEDSSAIIKCISCSNNDTSSLIRPATSTDAGLTRSVDQAAGLASNSSSASAAAAAAVSVGPSLLPELGALPSVNPAGGNKQRSRKLAVAAAAAAAPNAAAAAPNAAAAPPNAAAAAAVNSAARKQVHALKPHPPAAAAFCRPGRTIRPSSAGCPAVAAAANDARSSSSSTAAATKTSCCRPENSGSTCSGGSSSTDSGGSVCGIETVGNSGGRQKGGGLAGGAAGEGSSEATAGIAPAAASPPQAIDLSSSTSSSSSSSSDESEALIAEASFIWESESSGALTSPSATASLETAADPPTLDIFPAGAAASNVAVSAAVDTASAADGALAAAEATTTTASRQQLSSLGDDVTAEQPQQEQQQVDQKSKVLSQIISDDSSTAASDTAADVPRPEHFLEFSRPDQQQQQQQADHRSNVPDHAVCDHVLTPSAAAGAHQVLIGSSPDCDQQQLVNHMSDVPDHAVCDHLLTPAAAADADQQPPQLPLAACSPSQQQQQQDVSNVSDLDPEEPATTVGAAAAAGGADGMLIAAQRCQALANMSLLCGHLQVQLAALLASRNECTSAAAAEAQLSAVAAASSTIATAGAAPAAEVFTTLSKEACVRAQDIAACERTKDTPAPAVAADTDSYRQNTAVTDAAEESSIKPAADLAAAVATAAADKGLLLLDGHAAAAPDAAGTVSITSSAAAAAAAAANTEMSSIAICQTSGFGDAGLEAGESDTVRVSLSEDNASAIEVSQEPCAACNQFRTDDSSLQLPSHVVQPEAQSSTAAGSQHQHPTANTPQQQQGLCDQAVDTEQVSGVVTAVQPLVDAVTAATVAVDEGRTDAVIGQRQMMMAVSDTTANKTVPEGLSADDVRTAGDPTKYGTETDSLGEDIASTAQQQEQQQQQQQKEKPHASIGDHPGGPPCSPPPCSEDLQGTELSLSTLICEGPQQSSGTGESQQCAMLDSTLTTEPATRSPETFVQFLALVLSDDSEQGTAGLEHPQQQQQQQVVAEDLWTCGSDLLSSGSQQQPISPKTRSEEQKRQGAELIIDVNSGLAAETATLDIAACWESNSQEPFALPHLRAMPLSSNDNPSQDQQPQEDHLEGDDVAVETLDDQELVQESLLLLTPAHEAPSSTHATMSRSAPVAGAFQDMNFGETILLTPTATAEAAAEEGETEAVVIGTPSAAYHAVGDQEIMVLPPTPESLQKLEQQQQQCEQQQGLEFPCISWDSSRRSSSDGSTYFYSVHTATSDVASMYSAVWEGLATEGSLSGVAAATTVLTTRSAPATPARVRSLGCPGDIDSSEVQVQVSENAGSRGSKMSECGGLVGPAGVLFVPRVNLIGTELQVVQQQVGG